MVNMPMSRIIILAAIVVTIAIALQFVKWDIRGYPSSQTIGLVILAVIAPATGATLYHYYRLRRAKIV